MRSQAENKRRQYLRAVKKELGEKQHEELLEHIAFCWKKQDDQAAKIKELKYDLMADPRPRRNG